LTSEGIESQVYSGLITKSRAKVLTHAEVTLQSSVSTFNQGKDQLKEYDKVTSPAFYDLRTLFQEEELSTVIPQEQIIGDDRADNMPGLSDRHSKPRGTNARAIKEACRKRGRNS